jgi:hypothetical protein
MDSGAVMKILSHLLTEATLFDELADYLSEEFGFQLVDGDWAMKHAFLTEPDGSVGVLCATTWVDMDDYRVYYAIGRGGMLVPRHFHGDHFPIGTEFLVTKEEPGDGAGGEPADAPPS